MYRHFRPLPIIAVALAATIVLSFGIPLLKSQNDVKSMLSSNNKQRLISDLYDSQANFGSSNAVFVGIETDDIYSAKTLSYIKTVKDKIESLNVSLPIDDYSKLLGISRKDSEALLEGLHSIGINDLNYEETLVKTVRSSGDLQAKFKFDRSLADRIAAASQKVPSKKLFTLYDPPLGKIQSLVNADYIACEDDALVSKKLIDNEELTPENIAGLRARVNSWDSYRGMIVSKDEKMTSIVIILKTEDNDAKTAFNAALVEILKSPPAGYNVFVAGEPVVADKLAKVIAHDMPTLIPIVFIVIILLLFFCFRSFAGIAYPLLVTIMSILWTLGLMGYLGVPLSLIAATIPVLLMAIVSAYGIHQVNHFVEDPLANKRDVLERNKKSVGLAILLSGITVMVGFGAMVTQSFVPIRDFGIFTAFGDLIGVAGSLIVLPALLLLGGAKKKAHHVQAESEKNDFIAKFLRTLVVVNRKHSKAILAGSVVAGIVLFIGSFYVKSELDMVKFFKPSDSIQVADRTLNEKMAGTKALSVILDSDLRDPIARKGNADTLVDLASPEMLKKLDQFAIDVKKEFPAVQKVVSFSDVLKKMNMEMNGGDPAFYAIPDDQQLVSQYLMIFSGDTQTYLTANHDKLRISLMMNAGSTQEIHKIAEFSEAYFAPDFRAENHFQVLVSGDQQITYEANESLTKGTIESIYLCIIIVTVILLLVLRNVPMTIIGMSPIFFCLLTNFGLLGFTGTPLNVATAMVSSIGIGIGVDFSIHFITWYRRELLVDGNTIGALERSIINKGRAIIYNLAVIVGGFLVLLGSRMVPLNQLGWLTALCMTVTAAGSLIIVPALIRLLSAKDFKFLYLGTDKAAR